MPNTTNFNWATPADTDLVKDGAAAIRTLGNSIDTSFVDLKGGTTGQVLAKASNTDLDFTWATDASGIPATIFDAKGDIIAASAADTAARLAVGTNGQVLTADSSTATGLKWAGVSATPPKIPVTGKTFYVVTDYGATGTDGLVEDRTYYVPVYLPAGTVDRLAVRTSSSHTDTTSMRLGIYNNGSNNLPTTVLLDAGTVACFATNTTYEITISQTISTAGIYWLAANPQSGTAGGMSFSAHSTLRSGLINYKVEANNNATNIIGYSESGVTGAFATAGTLSELTNVLSIYARIS